MVDAVTKPALKTVAVKQRHEKLEIFLFAVMGGCRHEEKMARQAGEELPKVIPFGVFDFATEERG